MEIVRSSIGEIDVLTVSGDIDGSAASALQEQVLAAAKPNCKMLLDLGGVTFMSSAGLRVMLLLHRQISSSHGQVILVGLSEDLRSTMQATGFLKFFSLADTIDNGVASLSG
jgi:anti-sigma B factor antagonist